MCIMCLFNHMIRIWKESFPDHMIIHMWIEWSKIHLILIWLFYEVSCFYTIKFFSEELRRLQHSCRNDFFAKDFVHQYEIQECFKHYVWDGRGMLQRSHACCRALADNTLLQICFELQTDILKHGVISIIKVFPDWLSDIEKSPSYFSLSHILFDRSYHKHLSH